MDTSYFRAFDVDSPNAGSSWIEYVKNFDLYCMWHNIDNDDRKRAGLLTFAGDAVQQIYATIEANQPTDDTSKEVKDETNASFNPRRYEQMAKLDTYNDVCSKLTKHFNPQRNKLFERNIFRNTRQFADENIISFATRLRTAARHCQFHNLDEEILDTLNELSVRKFDKKSS